MSKKIIIIIAVIILVIFIILGALLYFYIQNGIYKPFKTNKTEPKVFEIKPGQGALGIAFNLEKQGIIKNRYLFAFYVSNYGKEEALQAGKYLLSPNMSIAEIVSKMENGEVIKEDVVITIPEGFSLKKIEKRLNNSFPEGSVKFEISKFKVSDFQTKYDFLKDAPVDSNLEGYLFPDTYIFKKESSAKDVVEKFLDNFDKKLSSDLREEIKNQGKTIHEIVTLASIVEKEVKTKDDREIVAGIFWKRLKNQQPLESCATINYIIGEDKWVYTREEIENAVSPYNTYLNKGLPPGPISNPGLESIKATIFPKETDFNYFLTDPKTQKTIFSKTYDEHLNNRQKYFNQ
mgnify:CR=1 FL=1